MRKAARVNLHPDEEYLMGTPLMVLLREPK